MKRHFRGIGFLAITLSFFALHSALAEDGEPELKKAAEAFLPFFDDMPSKELAAQFTESFLKAVPAKRMEDICRDLHKDNGLAKEFRLVRMTGPFAGEVEFIFAKGSRVPTTITLEAKPPHKIIGILFKSPIRDDDTKEKIEQELKSLPGGVSFSFVRLFDWPETIWEMNGGVTQAVGSSFKLIVLAALADEVNHGKRSWRDAIMTSKEWNSLPSGQVQDWPEGSPVTLHTLATLMISRSDNTATDHLIRTLGREIVEEMQNKVGVKDPERNVPFLCTSDMFKIKLVLDKDKQQEYLKAGKDDRRKLLDSAILDASLSKRRGFHSPLFITEIEWLFSTNDLCRAMSWFRRDKSATARQILSVNKGLSLDDKHWTYIGYKGGSEPGVLNFTFLLQDKSANWFAFSISWNNPDRDVDLPKLGGLAERIVRLMQKSPPGSK